MSKLRGGQGRALFALGVLTFINFFNYLDRLILAGVLPKVKATFGIDNFQAGLLSTIFMVVYMCASPLAGYLGDRFPRRLLIASSVMLWSLATAGSGLAATFGTLLVARAITGIGEAGYGTVAPAMISDLFPKARRTLMLSLFYCAMPLGAGAGYIVGGAIGEAHSWNMAFFVGGAPGILLALAALFFPEPVRGGMDEPSAAVKVPFLIGMRALLGNGMFWVSTIGLTLMTFSIGGLSNFMPTFLVEERHFSLRDAGLALGAITVIAGFVGTLAGGFLGDWLEKRRLHGGVLVSGIGLAAAAPLMVVSALATTPTVMFGALFFSMVLLFVNTGPLNASIVNAVPPAFRAFAVGINTLLIHLLGDAASPTVIGWVADKSTLGSAIALNAIPVVIGGGVLLLGVRWVKNRSAHSAVVSAV